MKLASLKTNHPDGELVLISQDQGSFISLLAIAPTMQIALENWAECYPAFETVNNQLNDGLLAEALPVSGCQFTAPLPRTWQWLDGSLFLNHGHLMQQAFHLDPIADADIYPLVYQGAGDNFIGGKDDICVADLTHGIDFEGEYGVIVDDIPLGSSAEYALKQIRLVVLLNDISYRALGPREMKTGFGFVQAKGATAFAPFAITPDELGEYWQEGRVCLPLEVKRNGALFGQPSGKEMHFGFHELLAHVAQTRAIKPGSVFGSGTVSNAEPSVGQACISELRAKEMIQHGKPQTPFMGQDEVVTINVVNADGDSVFGVIEQRITVSN
ncbi:fumarylacetoacetate hydrolase family protein [Shewanella sp. UCD-KL21]|uniref:fumarylacetoacetate hydrolase family protein n=1 Tax=Shewanella sp. UCD-KL21 TaxID=1917164 RepID=UPI0009712038|nr:fumarylacetoacetate hydrolase family protein [Shewanella sp. UCD-KL21]